jgi:hypothetical protein
MNHSIAAGHRAGTHQVLSARASSHAAEPSVTEALVDPASVFLDPADVVEHPGLTHEEKRIILLSWVRDELVLQHVASNTLPELRPKSRIDRVIEALRRFDASAADEYCIAVASIRGSSPEPVLRNQPKPRNAQAVGG